MGVAESPLRDRVIFIEGAPRSGTTLLVSLVAAHPDIAGTVAESHLFDRGVRALFENHALHRDGQTFLAGYVEEAELEDLSRDLCDGVLATMRSRIKPGAGWVVEKTPAPAVRASETMEVKRRVYPDAWHLHVVRDREAVVRSLMRAPWCDLDEGQCREWWRSSVDAVRAAFGESERYLELDYDALSGDPGGTLESCFQHLDLELTSETMARVAALSRERISSFGPPPEVSQPAAPGGDPAKRRPTRLRRALRRARAAVATRRDRGVDLTQKLIAAARAGDSAWLEAHTHPEMRFSLHSGAGELEAAGAEGRRALLAFAAECFDRQFVSETWAVTGRSPLASAVLTAILGDGRRIDLAVSAAVEGGRVVAVSIVSAGTPAAREPDEWRPEAERVVG